MDTLNTVNNVEDRFMELMNAGYAQAADSFSRFISRPVSLSSDHLYFLNGSAQMGLLNIKHGKDPYVVLTTHLIGAVSGRSYLILGPVECQVIFDALKSDSMTLNDTLKDAMLLEMDNILSASVISRLSDALKLEIYGDVPMVQRFSGEELKQFMCSELERKNTSSLVVNTTFVLQGLEHIHPHFVWQLDSKAFNA